MQHDGLWRAVVDVPKVLSGKYFSRAGYKPHATETLYHCLLHLGSCSAFNRAKTLPLNIFLYVVIE